MAQNKKMYSFLTMSYQKQAERQIGAVPGRKIDWYVDEPGATEFFKKIFAEPKFENINVVNVPMTSEKARDEFLSYYLLGL